MTVVVSSSSAAPTVHAAFVLRVIVKMPPELRFSFTVTSVTPVVPRGALYLKLDPFERFIHARGYDEWAENRSWLFGEAGKVMANFIASFKEYPPSQKSLSVQVTNVGEMINSQATSH